MGWTARSSGFTPWERASGAHELRGCVDPRAGLDSSTPAEIEPRFSGTTALRSTKIEVVSNCVGSYRICPMSTASLISATESEEDLSGGYEEIYFLEYSAM
jgi:hypothetical protein